jgi:mono/diheme cytochrome c family protein
LVLDQIRLGSGQVATYTTNKKFTVQTPMPKELLKGQDAVNVAAYVASVAGQQGYDSSASFASFGTDGAKIFKGAGCAGCHTLTAAGSTGTIGPNLDQLKPPMAAIVKQVTNGGALMPPFAGKLSAAQIQAVAQYVSSSVGSK